MSLNIYKVRSRLMLRDASATHAGMTTANNFEHNYNINNSLLQKQNQHDVLLEVLPGCRRISGSLDFMI